MFNCAHNHCEHNYNRRSFFSKHFSIKCNEADRFEGSPYSHGTDPVENPRQLVLDELVWHTEINKASTIRLIVLGLLNARSQFPIRAVSEPFSGQQPSYPIPYKRKTPWFLHQGAIYGRGQTRTADFTDVNPTDNKTQKWRF